MKNEQVIFASVTEHLRNTSCKVFLMGCDLETFTWWKSWLGDKADVLGWNELSDTMPEDMDLIVDLLQHEWNLCKQFLTQTWHKLKHAKGIFILGSLQEKDIFKCQADLLNLHAHMHFGKVSFQMVGKDDEMIVLQK